MPTWAQAGSGDVAGNACLLAIHRSGNNAGSGPYEYALGGVSGSSFTAQYTWGSSGGGLESGNVDYELDVPANGGSSNLTTLAIGTGSTLSYGGKSYNRIIKVGVLVQVDGLVTSETSEWTSLTIVFYDGLDNPSGVNITHLPSAVGGNGTATGDFWIATPDTSFTAVRVEISGTIHLNASQNAPGQNALVGKVYVWTDTCT